MKMPTPQESRERLLLMATMLDEVTAETWKPSDYKALEKEWRHMQDVGELEENELPDSAQDAKIVFDLSMWGDARPCGFQACAVGHALLDERFTSLGLGAEGEYGFQPAVELDEPLTIDYRWEAASKLFSWAGVRAFFGIEHSTAEYLFSEYKYNYGAGPAQVAERIRQYVHEKEEEGRYA